MKISAVIPVCNEDESVGTLHGELSAVARDQGYDLQIVFIDDGSTDDTWKAIRGLAQQDPRVHGIRFRRNFGKAAALTAGFRAATGDVVITLDGDLQDDPAEIPRFLKQLDDEHLDVISGWKQVRHDPWHKVGPSRVFNGMVSWLTGVKLHDHNCGMKCYRREVLGEVQLYGELHRFVPVLAAARGFKVGEMVVTHRPRQFGQSKYGVRRFVKGFLDLLTVTFLTGFGQRPQHLLGTLGLLFFVAGGAELLYLAGYWLVNTLQGIDPKLHQRPAVIYSVGMLLLGGQLLSIGLLAEMITSFQSRTTDAYSIAEQTVAPADPHPTPKP
ncbi:MAG: glycosyltransferase family 2 protein [Planctomycetes bacterium]|nr:glycosyltransferase family 2 protein [Planctomycetota bacterium]